MIDKSLAQELEGAAKKSRRNRRLLASVSLAAMAAISTLVHGHFQTRSATETSKAVLINPVENQKPSGGKETSAKPAPSGGGQVPQVAPNTTPPVTSSSTDMAVVDATMCRKMTEEAIAASIDEVHWYYDEMKEYRELYYGRWESPEAVSAFADTRAFTKKWYSDYIGRSDPTYKRFCHTDISIRAVMHEPDYSN